MTTGWNDDGQANQEVSPWWPALLSESARTKLEDEIPRSAVSPRWCRNTRPHFQAQAGRADRRVPEMQSRARALWVCRERDNNAARKSSRLFADRPAMWFQFPARRARLLGYRACERRNDPE